MDDYEKSAGEDYALSRAAVGGGGVGERAVDEGISVEWTGAVASSQAGEEELETRKPTLPIELIDDILSKTSEAALAQACLVSRSFLALARPHLYASIHLDLYSNSSSIPFLTTYTPAGHDLYLLLLDREGFASYVQSLTATLLPCDTETLLSDGWCANLDRSPRPLDRVRAAMQEEQEEEWLRAHEVRIHLLASCLPNLQHLIVVEDGERDELGVWIYGATLKRPLDLPRLTHLSVGEFSFSLLRFLPSLVSFDCTFNFRRLEENDLYDSFSPPAFRQLSLHLSPQEYGTAREMDAFTWLVSRSHSTLHTLHTYFDKGFYPSLSSLVSLKSFSLFIEDMDENIWTLPAVVSSLNNLPASLEVLRIQEWSGAYRNVEALEPSFFLAHLPSSLLHLRVNAYAFHPDLLLSFVRNSSTLAPQLKKLHLWSRDAGESWTEERQQWIEEACAAVGVEFVCAVAGA